MPYGYKFSTVAGEKLPTIPAEVRAQFEHGLDKLAADPVANSRLPVSPPFVPLGHQCDIRCQIDGRTRYNIVIQFFYSECGRFLEVQRLIIQDLMKPPEIESGTTTATDFDDSIVEIPVRGKTS